MKYIPSLHTVCIGNTLLCFTALLFMFAQFSLAIMHTSPIPSSMIPTIPPPLYLQHRIRRPRQNKDNRALCSLPCIPHARTRWRIVISLVERNIDEHGQHVPAFVGRLNGPYLILLVADMLPLVSFYPGSGISIWHSAVVTAL